MSLAKIWFKLTHRPAAWHFLEYLPDLQLEYTSESKRIIFRKSVVIIPKNLSELADLFTSQSVFLVGSGPSIKEQHLEPLKQNKTMFLNGALTLIESHGIFPSAALIIDKGFIQRHQSFVQLIPKDTPCIMTLGVVRQVLLVDADFFNKHPLYLIEKATKPYNRPALKPEQLDHRYFAKVDDIACSLDMQHGFAEAGTVMFVAAQLMLYLRAARITLVGFDLSNASQPRFYETLQNRDKSGLEKALHKRIIPAFTLLKSLCEERGISLTNASHLSQMPYATIPFDPVLMPAGHAFTIPKDL